MRAFMGPEPDVILPPPPHPPSPSPDFVLLLAVLLGIIPWVCLGWCGLATPPILAGPDSIARHIGRQLPGWIWKN